jgi:hypothetical protein
MVDESRSTKMLVKRLNLKEMALEKITKIKIQ